MNAGEGNILKIAILDITGLLVGTTSGGFNKVYSMMDCETNGHLIESLVLVLQTYCLYLHVDNVVPMFSQTPRTKDALSDSIMSPA